MNHNSSRKKAWSLVLVFWGLAVWIFVKSGIFAPEPKTELFFLSVGQGDSELIVARNQSGQPVTILIDGGRNAAVMGELDRVLPQNHRLIDLMIMTHPQLDHFAGLIDVVRTLPVRAFLATGRKGEISAYDELRLALIDKKIPYIVIGEGDTVRYGASRLNIVSPSPTERRDKELNTTSIVFRFTDGNISAIYTGDAGTNVETRLAKKYPLASDVLKVGHHGSKFSSATVFLKAVNPKAAIIEVGKNTYGHPTKAALERLEKNGAQIFRTDLDGTVKIIKSAQGLTVTGL